MREACIGAYVYWVLANLLPWIWETIYFTSRDMGYVVQNLSSFSRIWDLMGTFVSLLKGTLGTFLFT